MGASPALPLRLTRAGVLPVVLALIAYAALMCTSSGPLSPPPAAASTSVVLTLPSNAKPELLGTSSNGQYFAYADNPPGWNNAALALHWYNQQTGADVVVGVVSNSDIGRISADGHHVVFTAWGSDPLGHGLVEGTVYEATIEDSGSVSYIQVSPTATTYPGGGLETQYGHATVSSDGSEIAYGAKSGDTYVWSRATQISTNFGLGAWGAAVLSPDGSVIAMAAGCCEQGFTEYSVSDKSVVRTLNGVPAANQLLVRELSSDGSYGVGFTGGSAAQTGAAYFNFLTGTVQVIPNSSDGSCAPGYYSGIAISEGGQNVAFGSLSSELVPDPSGGSLGYFSYDPATEQVVNQSGTFAGLPPPGDCPSVAITGDGQTTFFVSYSKPSEAIGWISGAVTDSEGKPLGSVSVSVFEASGSNTVPLSTTQTGSNGKYTVELPSGLYKVDFSAHSGASNYAPQYYHAKSSLAEAEPVTVTANTTTPEINAAMQPGGQITGTVTDSEGKPLEGVSVGVFEAGGSNTTLVSSAATNSTGGYTAPNLASGSYKVEFSESSGASDYAPQYYNSKATWAEAEPVMVTAGTTTLAIDAAMQPGGQITGTVTNSEGKALSGVRVTVLEADGSNTEPPSTTMTGSTGGYTVSNLASGSYKVEFSANSEVGNYAPQYYNAKSSLAEAEPVTVTAGTITTAINAAMQPGPALSSSARPRYNTTESYAAAPYTAESHAYIYKVTVSHAPVNMTPPSISGNTVQGQTLAEAHGSWTNYPTSYSYQWQDCDSAGNNCSAITGATSQTYTLTASDVGHTIRVQESATNAGGTGGPVASAPTTLVTAPVTGGGSTGTGGGSTGTGGSTGAGGLTGGGSTLGTGAGGMLSNAFTLGGSQPGSNGSLLVTADVPGPGTLTAQQAAGGRQASIAAKRHKRKGRAQPKLIQPVSVTATKAGAVTLTLKPTAAARTLLRGHRSVKVSVRITFTPTSGTPSSHTIQVTLKAPKGKHGA